MTAQQIRTAAIEARRAELLTVKEFAAVTREHVWSVYRRIREGRQPGVVRFGREIRIDLTVAARAPVQKCPVPSPEVLPHTATAERPHR